MIAGIRNANAAETADIAEALNVWERLAASIPISEWNWRRDGKTGQRDGKYFARFVPYIDFPVIFRRLMAVVPGEFDITMQELPVREIFDKQSGSVTSYQFACKARLDILGVVREDVGVGKDWKQAATDAVKRAAMRFGIGLELYETEVLFVEVNGDGKFPKPLEPPGEAYVRKFGQPSTNGSGAERSGAGADPEGRAAAKQVAPSGQPAPQRSAPAADEPQCPRCGSAMWDERLKKKNPRAPDWRCRDRSCSGVLWPDGPKAGRGERQEVTAGAELPGEYDDENPPPPDDVDGAPY